MSAGVIMYGPPASGKDTISAALAQRDSRYRQFRRLKVGRGRTIGYRMSTSEEIDQLRAADDIIWENRRYDSEYFVDRASLARELASGFPILHLGQVAAISAVKSAFPETSWLVVYLWCAREIAEKRAASRGTGDVAERIAAWDATEPVSGALFIDTGITPVNEAAIRIDSAVNDCIHQA